MTFLGHYNENSLNVYIPTKMLKEEGKIILNMTCNPYGCSDDGQLITFGYWETSHAYLLTKDGSQLDLDNKIALKQDQGPFNATKESLEDDKCNAAGNMGTATPKQFDLKANVRNDTKKDSTNTTNPDGPVRHVPNSFQSLVRGFAEKSSMVSTSGNRRNSQ